jgi:hypothetical protein
MLSLFYATSLIIAAVTYAFLESRRMINRNNQYQYALAYCHTKLSHHHY